jgi:hypothetical protein
LDRSHFILPFFYAFLRSSSWRLLCTL